MFQHRHVQRVRVADGSIKAQRPRPERFQLRRRARISTSKQRDIVAKGDKLLGQPVDDALGAAVEPRGNCLSQRGNLGDVHKNLPSNGGKPRAYSARTISMSHISWLRHANYFFTCSAPFGTFLFPCAPSLTIGSCPARPGDPAVLGGPGGPGGAATISSWRCATSSARISIRNSCSAAMRWPIS